MLLCEKNKCTGCGLCKEVCPKQAISFEYDRLGFRYPHIEAEKCVECGLCSKKCPELNPVDKEERNVCYLAWAKNDFIHFESASGGLSYMLAQRTIEQGGFSVGCVWDDDYNAILRVVNNLDDLNKTRGSKYVQSYITPNTWKEIRLRLCNGQRGIFFGLPCQVAAMKSYLGRKDGLVYCDILCHGGFSPLVHHQHIVHIRNKKKLKNSKINDIRFRGGKYDFFYTLWDKDKVRYINDSESDTYFYSFHRHYLFRNACYSCSYAGAERLSDITIGDFWGINQDFIKNKHTLNGMNLVLAHTEKGIKLLEELKEDIELFERSFDEAIIGNEENLVSRDGEPAKRNEILNRMKEVGFEKAIEQDEDFQVAARIGKRRNIRVRIKNMLPQWCINIIKTFKKK